MPLAQFEKFGKLGDVYIPRVRACPARHAEPQRGALSLTGGPACAQDHMTKQSRGFAFVRFHDRKDAEARQAVARAEHGGADRGG